MLDRLEAIEKRYIEIEDQLEQPAISTDHEKLQTLAQEKAEIEEIVAKYREYKKVVKAIDETQAMLDDSLDTDMSHLVKDEIEKLKNSHEEIIESLKQHLIPKDANENKDVIMEIRAGTGGEEATLFAADLFRMYSRYAQNKGWQIELIDCNQTELGGFKEVVFEVRGKGAYSYLKYESGVHRVQRVPKTEASGRIHTSTATVAVLPEVEDVEININPDDIKMDFFRSGGAGGQNVNKVTTAVRITHLPTGIVATCQDERSQHRNRTKAMAVLKARLFDIEQRKQSQETTDERRSQIGTGERSEKIRTYNYPQDRITDHRINLSLHNLPSILDGELDELIENLATNERARQLENSLL